MERKPSRSTAASRETKASGNGDAATSRPVEKRGYEFGGPFGAFAIVFGLPVLVYSFSFFCNDVSGCPAPALLRPSTLSIENLKKQVGWPPNGVSGLFDWDVTVYVLGYYLVSLILQIILPGAEVAGVTLACGGRHKYKLNALPSAVLILAACGVGTLIYGADFPLWSFLWDNHLQVITANLVIASSIAVFVYIRSFSVPSPGQPNPKHRELAAGGTTGNFVYDFFMGRELNPRVTLPIPFLKETTRTLDIKLFCEMRPGLLGWVILDLANVAHQYKVNGQVTSSILFVTFFQAFYVLDSLYMEPAILTTMDVIMDGFGYMLSFGDLVWLPFTYTIQTRYLAIYPLEIGIKGIVLVLAVQAVGYYIFRSANNQKDRFRTNPNDARVKRLQYIQTASGSRLITSGWWGYARHINYLGDWIMSWSYCLPTGIAGYIMVEEKNPVSGAWEKRALQTDEVRGWGMIVTYFYMLYFAVLLIHRERRDEEKCKRKYGADWDRYTAKVRSRIVPGIY